MKNAKSIPVEVWRWVRQEMSHDNFGYWVYANEDAIKSALPTKLADELLTVDFWPAPVTGSDVERLRMRLMTELPRSCACPLMFERQVLPLGFDFLPRHFDEMFETFAERTPWVRLSRCRSCGQHWYVGCDAADDYWFFERVDADSAERILRANAWPSTFDGWENLWPSQTGQQQPTADRKTFRRGIITNFEGDVQRP